MRFEEYKNEASYDSSMNTISEEAERRIQNFTRRGSKTLAAVAIKL